MNETSRKDTELTKYEWETMQDWIRKYGEPVYDYFYQYRIGDGVNTEAVKEKWLRMCIRHNSRLKIDCVVTGRDRNVKIIEVKNAASAGAIGQLFTYKYFYDKQFNTDAEMVMLCRFVSDDIKEICELLNIKVYEMEG